MNELVDWLRAQIDEDERLAREAAGHANGSEVWDLVSFVGGDLDPGGHYSMSIGSLVTINPEELMAVETGDHRVENMRHRQFAALRTHGEWFRYEGALVDHITAIRRTIQC